MQNSHVEEEKLRKFIDAVHDDIDEKVAAILKEAEEEKELILKAASENSEAVVKEHLSSKTKKTGNRFTREISAVEFKMKKEVLIHREALIDKIFTEILAKLEEYRKTPAYLDSLIKKLIMLNITGEAEIRLAPIDMIYVENLKKALKSDGVSFVADDYIKLGGLSVYFKNNGTIVDKTFDLAVEEQKTIFVNNNAFAN